MLLSSEAGVTKAESTAVAQAAGEDLAIKYLEFCVNELKLKARTKWEHLGKSTLSCGEHL